MSAGIDSLFGKFLKRGTDILARPISQLCNFFVKLNSFSKSCKTEPQNYHPISLLPLLSKIIERIFHDQTQEFLSEKNSL